MGSLRKTDEDVTEKLRQRNFAQKGEIKGFLGLGFEKLRASLGFGSIGLRVHEATEKLKATSGGRWSQESVSRQRPFQAEL